MPIDFSRLLTSRQEYLAHVKAEIVAENAMVEQFVREQMGLSNEEEVRSRLVRD